MQAVKKGYLGGCGWLGCFEVLRSLKHYIWAQNKGHHTINSLGERGIERGRA